MAGNEILWRPRGGQTNMDAFRERVNEKYSLSLGTELVLLLHLLSVCYPATSLSAASYQELWTWSVEHYDQFWEEFFLFSTIISSTPYDEVRETFNSTFSLVMKSGWGWWCNAR